LPTISRDVCLPKPALGLGQLENLSVRAAILQGLK
jgi:hypothetical protein